MGRQKKVLNCHKTEVLNDLLMKSTISGNLADVRKWIDQGANVNVKHLNGEVTPLAAAIIGENLKHKSPPKSDDDFLEIFKLLIEKGADMNQLVWMAEEQRFYPVIFLAIWSGLDKFVEHLMLKGADLNYRYRDNTNCLTLAVKKNHLKHCENAPQAAKRQI